MLVLPVGLLLILSGAFIIAFFQLLAMILLAVGILLSVFVCYRLGRHWWDKQISIDHCIPDINWSDPCQATVDSSWTLIRYPDLPAGDRVTAAHVIGMSGAWKAVVAKIEVLPFRRNVFGPNDLKHHLTEIEKNGPELIALSGRLSAQLAAEKQSELEDQIRMLEDSERVLAARLRPKLTEVDAAVVALASGGYFSRLRAKRLRAHLLEIGIQLTTRRDKLRKRALEFKREVKDFLDPTYRERVLQEKLRNDQAKLREIVESNEFAGAVAEVAVIDELAGLLLDCLVFNDVKLEAGRYIYFEGKPLMSAQIDSLVITPAGVFVIEVKNWSRKFADSGEGFNPFDQVSRASYIVYDRLKRQGIHVKVRAILATNGSLPQKGDQKVAVVGINRLKKHIESANENGANRVAIRFALGL